MHRRIALDLGVVNVLAVALIASFLNGSLGEWGGDNIQYELLARAIVEGQGYVDLHLVGTPAHVRYPPLFPLMLAPLVAFGAPLVALKGWVAVLSVAGLNAAYFLLARTLDRSTVLLAVLSTLASGAFLDPALSVMSEGPYFLISVVALLAVQRSTGSGRTTGSAAVAAGILVGAAILTRTVGIVLVPAVVAHAVLGRSSSAPDRWRIRRALIVATVAIVSSSPWFLWTASHESRGRMSYVGEFVSGPGAATLRSAALDSGAERIGVLERIIVRPGQNLADVAKRLAAATSPAVGALGDRWAARFSGMFVVVCAVLAATTLAGLGRALVVRGAVHDWYVAGYLAILAVWVGGGFRLVMPILVFLFAYWYEGVVAVWSAVAAVVSRGDPRRSVARAGLAGMLALACALVATFVVTTTFPRIHDRLRGRYATWWNEYLSAVNSLESVARPEDLVLSAPDNLAYYLAGLRAPSIGAGGLGERALLDALLASGTEFVISTQFQRTYAPAVSSLIRSFPERFREIDRRSTVRVYRVVRDSGTGPGGWKPGAPPNHRSEMPPSER